MTESNVLQSFGARTCRGLQIMRNASDAEPPPAEEGGAFDWAATGEFR
jgi:hypothetical protein